MASYLSKRDVSISGFSRDVLAIDLVEALAGMHAVRLEEFRQTAKLRTRLVCKTTNIILHTCTCITASQLALKLGKLGHFSVWIVCYTCTHARMYLETATWGQGRRDQRPLAASSPQRSDQRKWRPLSFQRNDECSTESLHRPAPDKTIEQKQCVYRNGLLQLLVHKTHTATARCTVTQLSA